MGGERVLNSDLNIDKLKNNLGDEWELYYYFRFLSCRQCGELFYINDLPWSGYFAKFCSKKCYLTALPSKKYYEEKIYQIICAHCGEIEMVNRRQRDKTYCSIECCKKAGYPRESKYKLIINGKKYTAKEWAKKKEINYAMITSRIRRGWNVKDAFLGKNRKRERK